jgi:hypothetical protein
MEGGKLGGGKWGGSRLGPEKGHLWMSKELSFANPLIGMVEEGSMQGVNREEESPD